VGIFAFDQGQIEREIDYLARDMRRVVDLDRQRTSRVPPRIGFDQSRHDIVADGLGGAQPKRPRPGATGENRVDLPARLSSSSAAGRSARPVSLILSLFPARSNSGRA